ncbi:MAG TPA: NAD-dependent epimerase/dehydratase family protein, partial [Steroidobacteraceae bacterium]|nr:NAD-dependent epimerase/dehydratase family protein [Steroidobacteraceae bacterium]
MTENGYEVTATGRAVTVLEIARRDQLAQVGVRVVEGSLLDVEISKQVVSGCDAVIHLAAAQHEGNVPDSYFHDANVVGTRTLIDAAVNAGVRRFVYGSTIGVYGHASLGELDESSPTSPDNIYTRTKLEAEQTVTEYSQRIEVCIARISETYGPGDMRLLKLFRGIGRGRFILLGDGENVRQVIYVEDLCRALLLASELPAAVNQTFVFSGSDVMTTNTMVKTIGQAFGRRGSTLRI